MDKRERLKSLYKQLSLPDRLRLYGLALARSARRPERRVNPRVHYVGDRRGAQQPEGPFPELAPGLALTIMVCVGWVLGWSLFFTASGLAEGLLLTPVFIGWVFFVLFFRGIKLRLRGVV